MKCTVLSFPPSIIALQNRVQHCGTASPAPGGAIHGRIFCTATQPPETKLCGSVGRPPEPKLCGSVGRPPITTPKIQLSDGRFLAYAEYGVPRERARFKIVYCHGFSDTRLDALKLSPELIEELGVYMVSFDRPGYAESDPDPRRCLKSTASDIEELADSLNLGPKFFLIGLSLGCHAVWASLKYIPERLAGAALLAPTINYRWPGFPKNLSKEFYYKQDIGDQWTLRLSYYAPWMLHWWTTQSWLPTSTVIKGTTYLPNRLDARIRNYLVSNGAALKRAKLATKQGIQESYLRDIAVMFGKWEFDPMDLPPASFPVHLWQGGEDGVVPVELQRYICSRLSWINYHELPSRGHYLLVVPGFVDGVIKNLLAPSNHREIHSSQFVISRKIYHPS